MPRTKTLPRKTQVTTKRKRSRDQVKKILYGAFRREFPTDTVDISDGFEDLIHVMVVSRRFDKLPSSHQHDWMWRVINRSGLNDAEKELISLVYSISPAEIK